LTPGLIIPVVGCLSFQNHGENPKISKIIPACLNVWGLRAAMGRGEILKTSFDAANRLDLS